MKMTNCINQLNGKEQNAIFCIKKLIVGRIQPLIIWCFGCETTIHTKRSAFTTRQYNENRQFACNILVIVRDAASIDETAKQEIKEMTSHFGEINMVIHPLSFVIMKMKEGNLFFNWIHREGMVLLNRNNSIALLPPVIEKTYRTQAAAFYDSDPEMKNYLHLKIQPKDMPPQQKAKPSQTHPIEIKLTLDATHGWQKETSANL